MKSTAGANMAIARAGVWPAPVEVPLVRLTAMARGAAGALLRLPVEEASGRLSATAKACTAPAS